MWTRDAGVFLRELTLWGRIDQARLVATCLMDLVERNERGFVSFPERFQKDHPRHGLELDGTAAISSAFALLGVRLPSADALTKRIQGFLAAADGPLSFIVASLGDRPLLAGTGEFGPGCYLSGAACNVVQNHLCALALEARARWIGGPAASAWVQAAATLRAGIDRYLVAEDGGWLWCVDPVSLAPDPQVLGHVINRGFGGINGVTAMHADVHGLILADGPWRRRCEATLERLLRFPQRQAALREWGLWTQFDQLSATGNPNRTDHPGELTSPSYGHGYVTQSLLLTDQRELAGRALDGLAEHTFDRGQRHSPYYFHERMYAPPRPLAARDGCGELNLVCASEPRFRSKPVDPARIHALIPTYDEWGGLRKTLESLRALRPAPFKITVVNDNPDKSEPDWFSPVDAWCRMLRANAPFTSH